jgi:hypothetical protein
MSTCIPLLLNSMGLVSLPIVDSSVIDAGYHVIGEADQCFVHFFLLSKGPAVFVV